MSLTCTVQISGGLETIFGNEKVHEVTVTLPEGETEALLNDVVEYMAEFKLTGRPEHFVMNGDFRPGIIVLVDNLDWMMIGGLDAPVKQDSVICFISTLHGG